MSLRPHASGVNTFARVGPDQAATLGPDAGGILRQRSRRVKAVIRQPSDQIANRKRRGSEGGRPPAFDPLAYRGRNVIERSFNDHKQWRGLATRYDKLAAGNRTVPSSWQATVASSTRPDRSTRALPTSGFKMVGRGLRRQDTGLTRVATAQAVDPSRQPQNCCLLTGHGITVDEE